MRAAADFIDAVMARDVELHALAFDFGPPIEVAIARAEAETGLPGPSPATPLRWSPLESPEAAMERARG